MNDEINENFLWTMLLNTCFCVITLILITCRADITDHKINIIQQTITPIKSPKELKIEELQKQIQELKDHDKTSCTQ